MPGKSLMMSFSDGRSAGIPVHQNERAVGHSQFPCSKRTYTSPERSNSFRRFVLGLCSTHARVPVNCPIRGTHARYIL